jgi:hypothetical protein
MQVNRSQKISSAGIHIQYNHIWEIISAPKVNFDRHFNSLKCEPCILQKGEGKVKVISMPWEIIEAIFQLADSGYVANLYSFLRLLKDKIHMHQ